MAHILVIDDAKLIRELLKRALAKEGFVVSAACSAAEGLEMARSSKPDVVLLDLEMPQRDGIACLQDFRADKVLQHTPIIMVSGTPAREIVVRVAQIGVQGIIIKGERMVPEITRRVHTLLAPPPVAQPLIASNPNTRTLPAAAVVSAVPTPATPPSVPTSIPRPIAPMNQPVKKQPQPEIVQPPRTVEPASEEDDRQSIISSVLQMDAEGDDLEQATQKLRALKPIMTRSELLERVIEGNDLRAMKPAVQQVLSLTGSASASIESISRAIKQDQALSLKMLKVANSPIYTRGERVETVQKAVARIGVTQIRTTVLSLAVVDSFSNTGLAGRIKTDWFWEHSIAVGLIASKIARVLGQRPEQIDAMFTAGLLHDVGRVIYAERLGDDYTAVIDAADTLGMPLETVESRLLLVNHADLTDRLLRLWNFSPELINPIALHHLSVGNIRRTAPRMAESVATLGLANRLAHAMLLGSSGNESVYPIAEFIEFLKLSPQHLAEICATVPEQTLDTKLQMLSHGGSAAASMLDETRAKLNPAIRPLHVSVEEHGNAAQILLDRLIPGGAADAPNIAIVRISHVRERAQLVTKLRTLEQERAVKNLPTLVLGVGQGCFFADGMLGDRLVEQAVLPLRLNRVIGLLNTLVGENVVSLAA